MTFSPYLTVSHPLPGGCIPLLCLAPLPTPPYPAVFSRKDDSDDTCPGTVAHPPYWVAAVLRDGLLRGARGAAALACRCGRASADAVAEFAQRPSRAPSEFPRAFAEEPPGDIELV